MNRMIDKLLEEVVRGQTPMRVIEQHINGVQDHLQKESDVMESLMAVYPDLDETDSSIFDSILDRYYEDAGYGLASVLSDLLEAKTSKFLNNRLGAMIQDHQFKLR